MQILTSNLIEKLQESLEENGDLPLCVRDKDTNWLLGVTDVSVEVDSYHGYTGTIKGKVLMVDTGGYCDSHLELINRKN